MHKRSKTHNFAPFLIDFRLKTPFSPLIYLKTHYFRLFFIFFRADPGVAVCMDVQNTLVNNFFLRFAGEKMRETWLPKLATGAFFYM
jgi:alkylation response protein AidB-like acyl-CoA dehydrogenase